MCGSIAILALDQQGQRQALGPEAAVAKKLDAALTQIEHRGPDARGQWISPDKQVGPRLHALPEMIHGFC